MTQWKVQTQESPRVGTWVMLKVWLDLMVLKLILVTYKLTLDTEWFIHPLCHFNKEELALHSHPQPLQISCKTAILLTSSMITNIFTWHCPVSVFQLALAWRTYTPPGIIVVLVLYNMYNGGSCSMTKTPWCYDHIITQVKSNSEQTGLNLILRSKPRWPELISNSNHLWILISAYSSILIDYNLTVKLTQLQQPWISEDMHGIGFKLLFCHYVKELEQVRREKYIAFLFLSCKFYSGGNLKI